MIDAASRSDHPSRRGSMPLLQARRGRGPSSEATVRDIVAAKRARASRGTISRAGGTTSGITGRSSARAGSFVAGGAMMARKRSPLVALGGLRRSIDRRGDRQRDGARSTCRPPPSMGPPWASLTKTPWRCSDAHGLDPPTPPTWLSPCPSSAPMRQIRVCSERRMSGSSLPRGAKMTRISGPNTKLSAEAALSDVRRATRRRFSAEEKVRVVLGGLRGPWTASPSHAGARASRRRWTTRGPRSSSRPASGA